MKERPIKNVSVKQCIMTLLFSLFALAFVGVVPVFFGENYGIVMTFGALPIIGDGRIVSVWESAGNGFTALGMAGMAGAASSLIKIANYMFFIILCADIIFALLLAIFRINVLRKIVRIFSIVAGVAMIFALVVNFMQLAGIIGNIAQNASAPENIMPVLDGSGILTVFATLIMSGILIFKQFRWFDRLY